MISTGTYDIGPQTGALLVHTTREGAASRVGHELTITFDSWSGQVVVDTSGVQVEVTIEMASFHVLKGSGGVTPLTPIDKRTITRAAMDVLAVDSYPQATFAAGPVSPDEDGGTLDGIVTICGAPVAVSLLVTGAGDQTWHIETSLLQSSVGVTPYRAFFGALRVADRVGITADVTLAG